MSAFLTSLASLGSQFGQAKDEVRQEKEAREQKLHQMNVEDAYLQIAKQQQERQDQELEYRKKSGDLIEFKDGRIWSVSQGKFIDQQRPDPMVTLRKFVETLPPDVQKGARERAQAMVEANPGDLKGAISEVMRYADEAQKESMRRADEAQKESMRRADEAQKESMRRADEAQKESMRRADEATRHKEHEEDRKDTQEFQRQQRRELEAFQKNMIDWRLADKQKYMTPQERQVYDTIKQVEPSVTRTIDYLEQTKNSDGQPLKEENNYIFGDRSALMQHLRLRGYKFGTKQEDITQNLIKNAALLQVLGARPWMSMGRGKYMYEVVSQHLPQPSDTPAQLYDKLTWLRDNVLEDAKQSLAGYVSPGSGQTPTLIPGEEVEH